MKKKWNTNRVHRWAAVAVGLLLLMWTGSAMVMLGPPVTAGGLSSDAPGGPMDISTITMSPAEAMAVVTDVIGEPDLAWNLQLVRVGVRPVYDVRTAQHGAHLVDVETRSVLEIDGDMAETLVRPFMRSDLSVAGVERVDEYDFWYMGGSLPVYRVAFDNGTRVHVDPQFGTMRFSDFQTSMVGFIIGLHDLQALVDLFNVPATRLGMMVACFVLILVIGTGYWMSLPAKLRRRFRAAA